MFGLTATPQKKLCGLIIDIGSGSVGAAIVLSDKLKKEPEVVWSTREYVLIKNIDTLDVPLKEISTSLVNIFLQFSSDGIKALHAINPSLSIKQAQVNISAPWTYTITKNINFSDEESFEVDERLLQDLSNTANRQAITSVLQNEIFQESQLTVIDTAIIGTTINGYSITHPENIKTNKISLTQVTEITQQKITSIIEDLLNKTIPKATYTIQSFMYMYYNTLNKLNLDMDEACLIDITSEATEIGIVREGILTHVTNVSFGTYSLTREIAALCNIPQEEALLYLKGGTSFVETKLSSDKRAELQVILEAYQAKLTQLFKTTGDSLAIPKTLFLHCDSTTETFFTKRIEKAAYHATGMHHTINQVTKKIIESTAIHDTALVLSAYHFHQNNKLQNN